LTAGNYISITKDEATGETVIASTYEYDDTQIKADIQTNANNIASKASQTDLEALDSVVQGKADASSVTAISDKIGTDEMGTLATTITGAIAELKGITEGLPTDANFKDMQDDIDAVEAAVAKKADTTTVNTLSGRVDTLQQNSLSKETMGVGSFLVTNDGTNITYTAIEIVAGDGVTNALNDQPLTK